MLTGQRAFDGTNPASVIAAILERDAPSVAGVAPPALDRVLQRCLAKDPEERWQSARDVRRALAMVNDAPAVAGRRPTKRWTLAIASLVGFVAASALGVRLWATWPRPAARTTSSELPSHTPCRGGVPVLPDAAAEATSLPTAGASHSWRSRTGRPGCGFGPSIR